MCLFGNLTIQSTFTELNGTSFSWLISFGMYLSYKISYYAIDFVENKVYILNDKWSFVSSKTFAYPVQMITIGTSLYMSGDSNIWKLDDNLNVLFPVGTLIVGGGKVFGFLIKNVPIKSP